MLTQKNTQKPLPVTIAHLNELLDEALKETFPASDPIAINVELESPEHGIATTPGIPLSGNARRPGGGRGCLARCAREAKSAAH
jgi:hypothetical protein